MTLQSIKSELAELKTLLASFVGGKTSSADTAGFNTRLTAAEGSVTSSIAELATANSTIASLRAELKTSNDLTVTQAASIKDLTTKVEAGLKKANEVIASQGLDPNAVPEAKASAAGAAVESAFGKYSRLQQTNPQAAGEFYATDAVAILASRK
jgi:glutamate 5-kinase